MPQKKYHLKDTSSNDFNVVVIGESATLNTGITVFIKSQTKFNATVRIAKDSREGLLILKLHPETNLVILTMDPHVINSQRELEILTEIHRNMPILIFGINASDELMQRYHTLGAQGYINYNDDDPSFIQALLTMRKREDYFPEIELNKKAPRKKKLRGIPEDDEFIPNDFEKEILLQKKADNTDKEGAIALGIGVAKFKKHLQEMRTKTGTHKTAVLVKLMEKKGYI